MSFSSSSRALSSSTPSFARRALGLVLALACALPAMGCAVQAGSEAPLEAGEEPGASVGQTESALAPANWAWGFAWVNPGFAVSPQYSFNSGNAPITYSGSNGSYTVTMNELGQPGGNVQVVSYGSTATRCKVASWGPSGNHQVIQVRCHNTAGALTASPFVVFFNKGGSGQVGAHLYYSGTSVPSTWSWNSSGLSNSVTNTGTGYYSATLRGLAFANASLHVTAYGSGSQACKVRSWSASGSDMIVRVRCNDTAGNLVNTPFTLNYTSTTPRTGMVGGHAWINGATSAPSGYQAVQHGVACFSAGPATVSGFSAVTYPNTFVGSSYPSMTLSTAYGDDSNFCKVESWSQSGTGYTARTKCFTAAGAASTTTMFNSSFMLGTYPGPC